MSYTSRAGPPKVFFVIERLVCRKNEFIKNKKKEDLARRYNCTVNSKSLQSQIKKLINDQQIGIKICNSNNNKIFRENINRFLCLYVLCTADNIAKENG